MEPDMEDIGAGQKLAKLSADVTIYGVETTSPRDPHTKCIRSQEQKNFFWQ